VSVLRGSYPLKQAWGMFSYQKKGSQKDSSADRALILVPKKKFLRKREKRVLLSRG